MLYTVLYTVLYVDHVLYNILMCSTYVYMCSIDTLHKLGDYAGIHYTRHVYIMYIIYINTCIY